MSVLHLHRLIFDGFILYAVVVMIAGSVVTHWKLAPRWLHDLSLYICSLVPAVFALFWCYFIVFGAILLLPASAPARDAVDGVVQTNGPLVHAGDGLPFVVGRVTITCLGDGRPFIVASTMAGSRRVPLRSPSGELRTVTVPTLGPWTDSPEWRDEDPRVDPATEDRTTVDTLDDVPGASVAIDHCPPRARVHPRWELSVRALRPGDAVVVGHSKSGEGPFLWRGTLARVRAVFNLTPARLRLRGAIAGVCLLAALAFLSLRRRLAVVIEADPP